MAKPKSKQIQLKLTGFILGASRIRDNDLVIRFLGKDFGRIDGVCYGIKKRGSKFSGAYETFQCGTALFAKRASAVLWVMKEFESDESPALTSSWRHTIALQAGAELLLLGGPEERMEADMYEFAPSFIEANRSNSDPYAPLFAFAVKWLQKNGYLNPPESIKNNADKFIASVIKDDPLRWKKYKITAETRKVLSSNITNNIERVLERSWKGIRILERI